MARHQNCVKKQLILIATKVIYIYKEDCLSVSVCPCLSLFVSVCLSQCIRTVFKIQSWDFAGRLRGPRYGGTCHRGVTNFYVHLGMGVGVIMRGIGGGGREWSCLEGMGREEDGKREPWGEVVAGRGEVGWEGLRKHFNAVKARATPGNPASTIYSIIGSY